MECLWEWGGAREGSGPDVFLPLHPLCRKAHLPGRWTLKSGLLSGDCQAGGLKKAVAEGLLSTGAPLVLKAMFTLVISNKSC